MKIQWLVWPQLVPASRPSLWLCGGTLLSSRSEGHPASSWCLRGAAGTQSYSLGHSNFSICSCCCPSSVTAQQRKGVPSDTTASWGALVGLHGAAGSSAPPPFLFTPRMTHFSECPTGTSPISNCTNKSLILIYLANSGLFSLIKLFVHLLSQSADIFWAPALC